MRLNFGVLFWALLTTGCGTTTCEVLEWTRKPHPDRPAPAACYELRCGEYRSELLCVERPPTCLDRCFEGAR